MMLTLIAIMLYIVVWILTVFIMLRIQEGEFTALLCGAIWPLTLSALAMEIVFGDIMK